MYALRVSVVLPSNSNRSVSPSRVATFFLVSTLFFTLSACAPSIESSAPDLADTSILDVALNEIDFRYEWSHADLSGQVDVLDSYGNVARLTSDRRLLLTEGSSVRLSGSAVQGNADAEVWIFQHHAYWTKLKLAKMVYSLHRLRYQTTLRRESTPYFSVPQHRMDAWLR